VTEINFGQRAGAGRERKWGERKGSPKFISAWVVSRSGVTEINFGQRAGAGRKWGDRNKFRSTGRRGAVAEMGRARGFAEIHFGMGHGRKWGERKGSPKFISAWGRGGNGVTEINFGQRAGAGRKWGDRNKFRSTGRRGAEMGRAKGFAEIHFGMGHGRKWGERKGSPKFISAWGRGGNGVTEINFGQRAGAGRKWGDRNKFRSTGRRGAGAEMGRAKGFAEIHFGMGHGRKWGERKGSPKFISAWVAGGNGVTEINFGQRAGAGRKWGDRNKFRSTGRRGAEMGRPK
jgi:hypothetical protein